MDGMKIFEVHAAGTQTDGQSLASARMPFGLWCECADLLPKVIFGSDVSGKNREAVRDGLCVTTEEGSIRLIIMLAASAWQVLQASDFSTDLNDFFGHNNVAIERTNSPRIRALRDLGAALREYGATSVDITSEACAIRNRNLYDSPYLDEEDVVRVDSEEFMLCEIENLGGAQKVNANLRIIETGEKITAETTRDFVRSLTKNMLYKTVIAHVAYKVNTSTWERSDYRLIDFHEPNTEFDVAEFEKRIANEHTGWDDIDDPIAAIRRLRGADV